MSGIPSLSLIKDLHRRGTVTHVWNENVEIGDVIYYYKTEKYHWVISTAESTLVKGAKSFTCRIGSKNYDYWTEPSSGWLFRNGEIERICSTEENGNVVI